MKIIKGLKSFEEARAIARTFNLTSRSDYIRGPKLYKTTEGMPSRPDKIYKDKGWNGWTDFLGTGRFTFLPFEDARDIMRKFKFRSRHQIEQLKKQGKFTQINGIPTKPDLTYKGKGWIDWEDFLLAEPRFKNYEQAKQIVKTLDIKSSLEWASTKAHLRRGLGIPSRPKDFYAGKGWNGWRDFLGKE
jgi:hypothetical protein